MKRFSIIAALAFPILAMNNDFHPPVPEDVQSIIVEVTSASPCSEVTFEGSYVFKTDDSPLYHIEQKTPFRIQYPTDTAYGIFRSKSGCDALCVRLLTSNGSEDQPRVEGKGNVIVVGRLHKDAFITAF